MEQFDILENITILFLAESWMGIYVCVLGENEATAKLQPTAQQLA